MYDYPDISNDILIESEHGWSQFRTEWFVNGKQNTITLTDYNLICTPEHKIYIDNNWINANQLTHTINKNKEFVYDIINVQDNNSFYVYNNSKEHKVLVHNCLILDEFAFLSPSIEEAFLASVFPVVSSSKESQIIIVSTPNRYEQRIL